MLQGRNEGRRFAKDVRERAFLQVHALPRSPPLFLSVDRPAQENATGSQMRKPVASVNFVNFGGPPWAKPMASDGAFRAAGQTRLTVRE